ncbi:MAG: DUF1127 domain-containing protein [Rhodospirillales bacterium]
MIKFVEENRQLSMFADDMIERRLRGEDPAANLPPTFIGLVAGTVGKIVEFVVRTYTRRSVTYKLSNLSNRMLTDIGLTRGDIARIAEDAARYAGAAEGIRSQRFIRRSAEVIAFPKKQVTAVAANDDRKAA